jgi:hypothetical protein
MYMQKNKKENFIQICPICASTNFHFNPEDKIGELAGNDDYLCHNCGNVFIIPIEITEEKYLKLKKPRLTNQLINSTPSQATNNFGEFLIQIGLKIISLLAIFNGIVLYLMMLQNNNSIIYFVQASIFFITGSLVFAESIYLSNKKNKLNSITLKILLIISILIILFGFIFVRI